MVKVYSISNCPSCEKAKEYLVQIGLPFETINVRKDISGRNEMIALTGQMSVPVISMSGKFVVGFEKDRLDELFNI